jgi:hypothetical protein
MLNAECELLLSLMAGVCLSEGGRAPVEGRKLILNDSQKHW